MSTSHSTPVSGIYEIRNTANGKFYIGSSNNIRLRWNGHRAKLKNNTHANPHLQAAWNIYGETLFSFTILEYCPVSELQEREQHYLDSSDKTALYNIATYADPLDRLRYPSSETRERMSKAKIGRHLSKEHRQRIGDSVCGKSHPNTEETKRKISRSLKGRFLSEETKQRMSIARTGSMFSAEHRTHLSVAATGRKMSDEQRAILLEAIVGRKQSESHVASRIEKRKRDYILTSPDGVTYQVHGLSQFCKAHDLHASHLIAVARGSLKSYKGWKCEYA